MGVISVAWFSVDFLRLKVCCIALQDFMSILNILDTIIDTLWHVNVKSDYLTHLTDKSWLFLTCPRVLWPNDCTTLTNYDWYCTLNSSNQQGPRMFTDKYSKHQCYCACCVCASLKSIYSYPGNSSPSLILWLHRVVTSLYKSSLKSNSAARSLLLSV